MTGVCCIFSPFKYTRNRKCKKGQNSPYPTLSREYDIIPGNKDNSTITRYKVKGVADGKMQKNTFPLSKLLLIPAVETI
jgi:hypothetical protein